MKTYFLVSDLTFESVTRNRQWYQYAPTWDLRSGGLNDPAQRARRSRTSLSSPRPYSPPLVSPNLLLLSLPLVLGGYGRNMFINLGLSLGTSALFYALNFMCSYLGTNGHLSPELAASSTPDRLRLPARGTVGETSVP